MSFFQHEGIYAMMMNSVSVFLWKYSDWTSFWNCLHNIEDCESGLSVSKYTIITTYLEGQFLAKVSRGH